MSSRGLAVGALIGALSFAACSGSAPVAETRRERVIHRYPLQSVDFVATVEDGLEAAAVRRMADELLGVPGVILTEADYEGRVLRLVVDPGLSTPEREGVRRQVAARPGIARIDAAP